MSAEFRFIDATHIVPLCTPTSNQSCRDVEMLETHHPNDLVCALKHRIRFDLTLLKHNCNLRFNTDSVFTFILPPFSSMSSAVISDKNVSVTVSKSRLGATPPPPLLLLLLTVYCNSLASSSRCSVTGLIQQWDSIQIILADSLHNVSVPQLFFSFPWNPFPWCMCSPNSSWCHFAKQWRRGAVKLKYSSHTRPTVGRVPWIC